jgi:hypothetical protein
MAFYGSISRALVTQSAQRKIISVVDEAQLLDHGPPLALFAVDVLHVFRRRRDDRITAGIEQSLLHVFRTHDPVQFPAQPLDDRLRRAGRRDQSVILDDLEAGSPDSAMVGTSGIAAIREGDPTAIARSVPD